MPEENPSELEQLKKEREEYLNGWKRAKADLINYQKDEAKRFEEVIKYSNAAMAKDLIAVLDSFDLALTALEKEGKADGSAGSPQGKGIYMIKSQLEEAAKRHGLEKAPSSTGQMFDPNRHETVSEVESDQPQGTIIEEVDKGYLLSGRVVRPARVKIAK